MKAAWRSGGARIAGLLLLGVLLLVGQSVWAAGYRPPRSLGSWHLAEDGRTSRSPMTESSSDAAAGSKEAAPKPAEAAQLSPAEQDYWNAAAAKDKDSKAAAPAATTPAQGAAAAAKPQDVTAAAGTPQAVEQQSEQDVQHEQELEKQAAAEADARAAQNAAAVQGPDGEPDIEDGDDAGETPQEAGQQENATQAAPQQSPAAASEPAAAAPVQAAPQQSPAAASEPPAASPAQAVAAATQSPPAAAAPLQDMPYNLQELQDADALFKAHTQWQQKVLQEKKKGVKAIRVITGEGHGLGNRMPGIGTGYILAVLTSRLFLLDSTVSQHLEYSLPCVWKDHESLYEGVDSCKLGHFTKFVNPDLKLCGPPGTGQDKTATLLVQDCQFDYMVPMFQINPTLKPLFDKFFPDSEIYTRVARYLFKPKPVLQEAMKPYEELSKNCLVGMHLRTHKHGTAAPPGQFADIARAVAVARPGNIFVAADNADVFKQVQDNLPGREVWWNKRAAAELQGRNKTHAGNPGTELSAMMDLWLLSKCKNVILTPASSIGGLAAALGGILPVFANPGPHTDPFVNPWHWKALSSEPCFTKASEVHKQDTELAKRFRKDHPLFVYHNQCHFANSAVGFPAPTWECTTEACREFRRH